MNQLKMKFTTHHTEFFKEWRCGHVRILRDTVDKMALYQLQAFNGTTWTTVKKCRTLKEAKEAAYRW